MSSRLPPSGSLSTSLTSLHYPLLFPGFKCQDIRLPRAVSLAFPPEQHAVRDWRSARRNSWWSWRVDEQRIGFSRCRCQLKAFSFVTGLRVKHLILPLLLTVQCYNQKNVTQNYRLVILKMSKLSVHCNIHILQMATVSVVFASSYIMHI